MQFNVFSALLLLLAPAALAQASTGTSDIIESRTESSTGFVTRTGITAAAPASSASITAPAVAPTTVHLIIPVLDEASAASLGISTSIKSLITATATASDATATTFLVGCPASKPCNFGFLGSSLTITQGPSTWIWTYSATVQGVAATATARAAVDGTTSAYGTATVVASGITLAAPVTLSAGDFVNMPIATPGSEAGSAASGSATKAAAAAAMITAAPVWVAGAGVMAGLALMV